MTTITTKTGKNKTYKSYGIGVHAYSKKGYVKLIHKRTGKTRYFKL
jgi:hypothetical protein